MGLETGKPAYVGEGCPAKDREGGLGCVCSGSMRQYLIAVGDLQAKSPTS